MPADEISTVASSTGEAAVVEVTSRLPGAGVGTGAPRRTIATPVIGNVRRNGALVSLDQLAMQNEKTARQLLRKVSELSLSVAQISRDWSMLSGTDKTRMTKAIDGFAQLAFVI
jgi:hypothetical protein